MSNIKCIVISGCSNSGKTQTILDLIEIFKLKYEMVDQGTFSDKGNETRDKWAIFKVNGIQVGLFSQGDGTKGIEHGLRATKDCAFVIGASHLYGKTVETYFNYNKRHFEKGQVLFVNKLHYPDNIYEEENKIFLLNMNELMNYYLSY